MFSKYQLLFYTIFVLISSNLAYDDNINNELVDNDEEILTDNDDLLTNETAEQRLSDRILAVLEHYQQEDPIGIPGATVPDPMPVPPLKHSFPVARMDFKDMIVKGLSKFKIIKMKTDIGKMQMQADLDIAKLFVIGNYTMSTWLSRSAGPFTVNLTGVSVTGVGNLVVDRKGHLTLQEIAMNVVCKKIDMNFENLGFMGAVFQGIINSVGTFLFDSIKPFILKQANQDIRGDMNREINKLPYKFPNSISPFDMALAEARKIVRNKHYDPYKIQDYNHTIGLMDLHLTHTWLSGLSNFYRNGDITVELANGTTILSANVGTQRLKGSSHWEIGVIGGMLSRAGTFTFTIEYFKVTAVVNQSLDTRKHPILEDLQLDLGNIQVRCNGAGTADYFIEFIVNVLPNLLRYQIMDSIENPLKARIQAELNKTNIDKIAREKLPMLDEIQKNGFNF